jgi:fatty acid desaturase
MRGASLGLVRRAVFRHPIDAVPVALMTCVFAAQLGIFFLLADPARVLVAVVAVFPVQVNFAGMCHNHHHVNTFRHPLLNRAFEVMMFLQLGMLPYVYTLHHNIGHHRHYLDQTADSNRWRRADGTTMGAWEFASKLVVKIYPTAVRIGREHPRVYRKFRRMALVCGAVVGVLVAIHPLNALLVFLVPLPAALLVQAQATYHQHAGLVADEPLRASRSAVGRIYNLRTLNLGYHAAHHLRPSLHWSQLPAFHAEIAARLPAELVV